MRYPPGFSRADKFYDSFFAMGSQYFTGGGSGIVFKNRRAKKLSPKGKK